MTEGSKQERWETPVSDAESLGMVSLVDCNGLHITVEDRQRRRFRFTFGRVPAYRNILEEYRTCESSAGGDLGLTLKVPNSPWLEYFHQNEPLLEVHTPGCEHYVIITEDDVIDVLAPEPPEILEVAPADADEPPPGKSSVLYHPQDKKEIGKLMEDFKKRNQKDV